MKSVIITVMFMLRLDHILLGRDKQVVWDLTSTVLFMMVILVISMVWVNFMFNLDCDHDLDHHNRGQHDSLLLRVSCSTRHRGRCRRAHGREPQSD